MSLFHRHQWREHGRHHTPPHLNMQKADGPAHTIERLIWGVTVILLKCDTCGDQKVVEMLGNAGAPPASRKDAHDNS